MTIARSKITAQGQISVPAEVRRRLGVAPGETLEWDEANGEIVVRRAGQFSSQDIHAAIFPGKAPVPKSIDEMNEGIRRQIRRRHAGG